MRVVTLALVALIATRLAHAQSPDEATRLFDEGRELIGKGDTAAACDRFTRSYAVVAAVGTELNLGDCHERLGHLAEAWRHFDHAATESDKLGNAARAQFARKRADALLPKLATVVIDVAKADLAGLAIRINGRLVTPAASIRELVDPGDIAVAATAPNTPGFATSSHGSAGATLEIAVPALDAPATPKDAVHIVVRDPEPRYEDEVDSGRLHLAWGFAGGALGTAITGVAFLAVGRSDYNAAANSSHCTRTSGKLYCDPTGTAQIHHAQLFANISTACAIATTALGIAAIVTYVTAPTRSVIVPVAGNHTAGIAIITSF